MGDLEHAHLLTARDVDAVADQPVTFGSHQNASHGVAHPREVARLQTIAEHDQRLMRDGTRHEPWNELTAWAIGMLAGAVYVERPHDGDRESIRSMEAVRIGLAGQLRGGVRRHRIQGMVLVHRRPLGRAVDLGRRDIDKTLNPAVKGGQQEVESAEVVDQVACHRVGDRHPQAHDREVEDHIGLLDGSLDTIPVTHVATNHRDIG